MSRSPAAGTVVGVDAHALDTDRELAIEAALIDDRRAVVLDGVHNFRDLGGYPAAGGTTRWELVYRADGLGRLTPEDVEALKARGLGTVIDLRTDRELAERGRYPVDLHSVTFHHLPVLDQTWSAENMPEVDNAHEFLMWAYRDMLKVGADKIAGAIRVIAEPDATPVVFHCAAGKDRTGLVAALLLACLGVPDDFIAADYGKTVDGMRTMRAAWAKWAAEQGEEERARVGQSPAYYFECPPAVMAELLAELRRDHGSVIDFVSTLGITDAEIDALRGRLIEPASA
jgi:protein-tyrosine phosphatase